MVFAPASKRWSRTSDIVLLLVLRLTSVKAVESFLVAINDRKTVLRLAHYHESQPLPRRGGYFARGARRRTSNLVVDAGVAGPPSGLESPRTWGGGHTVASQ
jgi:hypothetical protein